MSGTGIARRLVSNVSSVELNQISDGLGPVGQNDVYRKRHFVLLVNTGKLGLFVLTFYVFYPS
jgi:hypothetical protein